MSNFFDNLSDVTIIVNENLTAPWRTNKAIEVIQWIIIGISLLDFSIYTVNFLYGLFLASLRMNSWERGMPFLIGLLFTIVRFIYVPFLTVLIPSSAILLFPTIVYKITFVSLIFMYVLLLIVPIIISLIWGIKFKIWKNSEHKSEKSIQKFNQKANEMIECGAMKHIIIIMPIYNEDKNAFLAAIKSIIESVYPKHYITVFLSFDSDDPNDTFLYIMNFLTDGNPMIESGYRRRNKIVHSDVTFIVNLFPHGGKRHAQAETFKEIKRQYKGLEDRAYVLLLDSDIILHEDCILEFIDTLDKNKNLIGLTGFVSPVTSKGFNPLLYLQDSEYLIGQIFARSTEASLGGVTCIPGALTMIRLREFTSASIMYFSNLNTDKMFDYHRYYLGEDRLMTHLLMEQSKTYSIGFCPSARCKTQAPDNWTSFIKQRRRWFLGAISNEVYFLSDYKLWKRVPFLILYKIFEFCSRSSSFFIYIVAFQMITGVSYNLIQTVVIWAPLAFSWILILVFSVLIHRFKAFVFYPLMMLINPWLYFFINIYSIFTWNTRSWGGVRASPDTPIDINAPETLGSSSAPSVQDLENLSSLEDLDEPSERSNNRSSRYKRFSWASFGSNNSPDVITVVRP